MSQLQYSYNMLFAVGYYIRNLNLQIVEALID